MAKIKFSRQRESIREYVKSRCDHPTADMVYREMRKIYPSISLGTVYRNLTFLADRGELVKLSLGEESERFDGNVSPHYHFKCDRCGKVSDIEMPWMTHIDVLASSKYDGEVRGHVAWFYGICSECRNLKKND